MWRKRQRGMGQFVTAGLGGRGRTGWNSRRAATLAAAVAARRVAAAVLERAASGGEGSIRVWVGGLSSK